MALGGDGAEKQALARAVEHQDLTVGIGSAAEPVAACRPFRRGATKLRRAFVARIAPEILDMRGDHRADEVRHRMPGLADAEIDDRLARLHVGDELGEAHERGTRVDDPTGRERKPAFRAVHGHLHTRPGSAALAKHSGGEVKARLTIAVKPAVDAGTSHAEEEARASPGRKEPRRVQRGLDRSKEALRLSSR